MRSLIMLLAGLLVASVGPAAAQEEASAATNIRVYQFLAGRVGDSLNAEIPGRGSVRVLLTVKPDATSWLLLGGIAEELQRGGRTVVAGMPADYVADLGILEMRVTYRNIRTEGLFTGKVVDREVRLNMNARLVDQQSGVVTLNRVFWESMRDTVQMSEIPMLEDPNVSVTQGALPAEGFFSSLVEPLIMLGAVAVAVYLLFTVRS